MKKIQKNETSLVTFNARTPKNKNGSPGRKGREYFRLFYDWRMKNTLEWIFGHEKQRQKQQKEE